MSLSDKLIRVGFIRKPHGLKGFVKISPLTDFPEKRFGIGASLITDSDKGKNSGETLIVAQQMFSSGDMLLRFEGFEDATRADTLRNLYLCINAQDREDLPQDEFYPDQLVGMNAFLADGSLLGIISKIDEMPPQPILEIKGATEKFYIPFVKANIESVDMEAEKIVLKGNEYAY